MASPDTKGPIGEIDRPLILEVIDLAREGSLSSDIALYVVGAGHRKAGDRDVDGRVGANNR